MTILSPGYFVPEPDMGAAVRHLFRVGAVLVGVRDLGLACGRIRGGNEVRGGIHNWIRRGIRSIEGFGGMGGLGGDGDGREDGGELHLDGFVGSPVGGWCF